MKMNGTIGGRRSRSSDLRVYASWSRFRRRAKDRRLIEVIHLAFQTNSTVISPLPSSTTPPFLSTRVILMWLWILWYDPTTAL